MTPRRVTISIPEDVAHIVDGMENVSAFFTDAARRADRRRRLDELFVQAVGEQHDELKRARIRASLRAQMARLDLRRLQEPRTPHEVSAKVADLLAGLDDEPQTATTPDAWRGRRAA
jgi:hypothetical protein